VVVLWSKDSRRSDRVLYEASRAHQQGKLVPVLLPPLTLSEVPAPYTAFLDILPHAAAADLADVRCAGAHGCQAHLSPAGISRLPAVWANMDARVSLAHAPAVAGPCRRGSAVCPEAEVQEATSAPVNTDVDTDVDADDVVGAAIDPWLFRRVMGSFASGVTVVTTAVDGPDGPVVRGMTVSAFMSGSLEPPLCVISIRKAARMHPLLLAAGHFGVSILAKSQERISSHFAGVPMPNFEPELVWAGRTPMLANATAVIAADTTARHDCGDHTLLLGRIRHMAAAGFSPLLVHQGRYAGVAHPAEPSPEWVVDIW
jgi:flavin reductase (DIM6/NTAB) family NADH-FMN oxidoreductase RutF